VTVTDEEIREKVFAIVGTYARKDPASLTLETTFEDLRMESLDIVQILFAIEDTFDVYVPTENQQLRGATLSQLCDGIQKLITARNA
jgi:acyl carrier protein